MRSIVTVVGARPQFIKAAMLSKTLAQQSGIQEIIVHTGQHYDPSMSDIFFKEMGIPKPKRNLSIGGGSQGQMTGRQLEAIEAVLLDLKPDGVLVYGDTNSTLAGALAAAKLNIPVLHVEAGLRSWNRKMPEEVNRVLTDHVSSFLFTPTETATANLEREGITKGVMCVGDIMYDAALYYGSIVEQEGSKILDDLGLESGTFRLATLHRQENIDDPCNLAKLLAALRDLAQEMPLVLPLHPRLKRDLDMKGSFSRDLEGIQIIDPVGFKDMIALLRAARVVATDSGGVQKEAYFHGTPAAVLRGETEWVELIDLGCAQLVPPKDNSSELISAAIRECEILKGKANEYPFGTGNTSEIIAEVIERSL